MGLSSACDGGCGCDAPLAELVAADGTVSRDFEESVGAWEGAAVGAEFTLGDGVKTGDAATARVALTGGGGLELTSNTIVRFLSAAPNEPGRERVAVEMGEATVSAGQGGLAISGSFGEAQLLSGGEAQLLSGGEMRVSSADGQLTLEVLIGNARIEPADGDFIDLGVGEELVLDIELGEIVLEELDAGAPDTGPLDAGPPDTGPLEIVAEEIAITFRGRVDIADEEGNWESLARGTESVPAGSRVRLRRRASLNVQRDGAAVRASGPGELVIVPPGGTLATITAGRANVDAGDQDVVVAVPGGTFLTAGGETGAQATVRVADNGSATVSSRRGLVTLQGASDSYGVRDGDRGVIRADGELDISGRPPARAHMALEAGASATLHFPAGTVNVRIRFGDECGGGDGVVEVARGSSYRLPAMRSFGSGQANISVSPGSNRYRLRCVSGGTPSGSAAAQGVLTVRRDSGRQQLPRRPSRNVVDTDGRRYTLLYQNILPIVSVRWPRAPSAGSYVLHVGDETHRTSAANKTLESGEVPEGTHRVFFEAPGASPSRSPVTTLSVRYDNATTAAYIREPAPGAGVSGTVSVSGTCVRGCSVSVGGTALPLDRAHRFSGEAAVPADLDALAIRIAHPRTGMHYYLRRAGGR